MWLLACLMFACVRPPAADHDSTPDDTDTVGWPSTGVVRRYEATVTEGDYELRMDGGMVMGVLHGYLMNGQFLGPTLVANAGDTIEMTLHNEVNVDIGLHPHGVRYDKDNEGMSKMAMPGESVTYTWEATNGPGTFLYHSHMLDDELLEYQAMAGILGVIVLLDPDETERYAPDHMINYVMTSTYEPWTEIDEDAMDPPADTADTGGTGDTGEPHEDESHNHTMVVQEVRGEDYATDTMEYLTTTAKLGETVRVNLVGFGEEFHTYHLHGYTWEDPYTGQVLDVKALGPAESYYFHLPELDNPGLWMTHCHVDDHFHMMSTYFLVE